jgi:hypothetical protein
VPAAIGVVKVHGDGGAGHGAVRVVARAALLDHGTAHLGARVVQVLRQDLVRRRRLGDAPHLLQLVVGGVLQPVCPSGSLKGITLCLPVLDRLACVSLFIPASSSGQRPCAPSLSCPRGKTECASTPPVPVAPINSTSPVGWGGAGRSKAVDESLESGR